MTVNVAFTFAIQPTQNGYTNVTALPVGFRPTSRIYFAWTSGYQYSMVGILEPTGVMTMYARTDHTTSTRFHANFSFVID